MHTLNTPEGEMNLDIKHVGSARFPICLLRMLP